MTPLLASRLARDPDRAFERLYRKHVRDVYTFSLGILGNPDDAEDVTQTTFMNAYRSLSRTGRIDNPRAWLVAIAHNVCRQRFRTAARRPQEVELGHDVAEALVEDEPPAADEIRAALNQLAFNQRTVLVLREIEGFSYAEIAELMGISVSAVETLLFRARRALREQLEAAERPLACPEAERLISRQLDGHLSRHERGQLRAHLRACPGCAAYARSQRAQKKAMRGLALIPLPAALTNVLTSSFGAGLATKAATVAVAAVVGTGIAVGTGAVKPPLLGLGQPEAKAESAPADPAPASNGASAPVASVVALEQRPGPADERALALERPRPVRAVDAPARADDAEAEEGKGAEERTTPREDGAPKKPAVEEAPAKPDKPDKPDAPAKGGKSGAAPPPHASSPPHAGPPATTPPPAVAVEPPAPPPGSVTPPQAKAPEVAPGLEKKIAKGKKVPTPPAASEDATDTSP